MYQIFFTVDSFGDFDIPYCIVATEEEAKRICDYGKLHGYKSNVWSYQEVTIEDGYSKIRQACHKEDRIKRRIKEITEMLQYEDEEWVEEAKNDLAKLEAELAELKSEVTTDARRN